MVLVGRDKTEGINKGWLAKTAYFPTKKII